MELQQLSLIETAPEEFDPMKYSALIGYLVNKFRNIYQYSFTVDRDDLIQEGYSALMDAYATYRGKTYANASFFTYAYSCISNHFIDIFRYESYRWHYSLDDTRAGDCSIGNGLVETDVDLSKYSFYDILSLAMESEQAKDLPMDEIKGKIKAFLEKNGPKQRQIGLDEI